MVKYVRQISLVTGDDFDRSELTENTILGMKE